VRELEKFGNEALNHESVHRTQQLNPGDNTSQRNFLIIEKCTGLLKHQMQSCRDILSAILWYEDKGPTFVIGLISTVAEAAKIADSMDGSVRNGRRLMDHEVPERNGLKFVHYSTTDVNRRSWQDSRGRYIHRI